MKRTGYKAYGKKNYSIESEWLCVTVEMRGGIRNKEIWINKNKIITIEANGSGGSILMLSDDTKMSVIENTQELIENITYGEIV